MFIFLLIFKTYEAPDLLGINSENLDGGFFTNVICLLEGLYSHRTRRRGSRDTSMPQFGLEHVTAMWIC
jgi:hypothetical protein